MKICLVYPNTMKLPSYFNYATNIITDIDQALPPIGLMYIIGNSKNKIDLIDNRILQYDFEKLSKLLMKYDVTGFGGTIFEVKEARRLSRYLMSKNKITLYGGPNATVNWNLYINYFNIIFRGEAELVFDDIIENLGSLEKLGFNKVENTYVNPRSFRILNLDKINFPDREKIDLNKYSRKETAYLGDASPIDIVVSSRGCPYDCYFCSSKVIWNRKYTYRSGNNVVDEIKFIINKYGTKGIYFREDNFTINRLRLIEFCEKVKNLNIVWMCESRVDTLDEEIIKIMANSGCRGIWFGLESSDNEVLNKIRKNFTLKQIKETINLCNKYGITTGGGFILGFPFDNKESIIKNYQLSKKLNLKNVFYNRVWAIPRSDMYDQIIEEGLDDYTIENIILPGTRYLSANQLNQLYYTLISRKEIFSKKIISFLGKKNITRIKKYLPFFYRMYKHI